VEAPEKQLISYNNCGGLELEAAEAQIGKNFSLKLDYTKLSCADNVTMRFIGGFSAKAHRPGRCHPDAHYCISKLTMYSHTYPPSGSLNTGSANTGSQT